MNESLTIKHQTLPHFRLSYFWREILECQIFLHGLSKHGVKLITSKLIYSVQMRTTMTCKNGFITELSQVLPLK